MIKASELLAHKVGPRVLMTDPEMRAIYSSLRELESHHHTYHVDCEELLAHDMNIAIDTLVRTSNDLEPIPTAPDWPTLPICPKCNSECVRSNSFYDRVACKRYPHYFATFNYVTEEWWSEEDWKKYYKEKFRSV